MNNPIGTRPRTDLTRYFGRIDGQSIILSDPIFVLGTRGLPWFSICALDFLSITNETCHEVLGYH